MSVGGCMSGVWVWVSDVYMTLGVLVCVCMSLGVFVSGVFVCLVCL